MNGTDIPTGHRYVALFIDWDNLAISTSADMGGASPDLGRIVQKAREFGTIVLAKAYAEWSVTSERMNVYRAGVEPAYAPTFRFEPDPSAPNIRSKSLADPCMVTDCVEALHLMPMVTDFIIVTGDKDLIPVVRLAQLRGKRVIVIGPDLSANVLREMADVFVPYRSLVEEGETRPAGGRERQTAHPERPAGEPITEARRLPPRGPMRPPEPAPPAPPRPARPEPAPKPAPAPRPARRQAPPSAPTPAAAASPTPAAPEPLPAVEVAAKPEPAKAETPPPSDLNVIFDYVVDLLKQRNSEGKNRVRATAIKDALLQTYAGFNERAYGFSKFKDLLEAAQRAGLIHIIRVGPVHWASLVTKAEQPKVEPEMGISAVESPEPPVPAQPDAATWHAAPPLGSTELEAAPAFDSPLAAPSEERLRDLIRFIRDLRDRSRWLTYTYVLTNVVTSLGETVPATRAEHEARALLQAMVQQGILHVDTEPREVEVSGARHRIRMCHLVETHPLVEQVLQEAEQAVVVEPEQAEPAVREEQPVAVAAVGEPPSVWQASPPVDGPAAAAVGEGSQSGIEAAEETVPTAEEVAGAVSEGRPRSRRRGSRGRGRRAQQAPSELPDQLSPEESTVALQAVGGESATVAAAVAEDPVLPKAVVQEPVQADLPGAPPDRESALQSLARLVVENTSSQRPRLRAPGLKQRMMRILGHFDERDYGFSRFGDFLDAASGAGLVVVEREGAAVWVSPPK